MNPLVKAFTKFCFHFEQVCAIIIAHRKMDDQICTKKKVDMYYGFKMIGYLVVNELNITLMRADLG